MRHPHGGLGQAVVLRDIVTRDGIDPVAEPRDPSVGKRRFQRSARESETREVTGPDDPLPAEQRVELGIKGASHAPRIQYVGTY
jgi:hypothetical protein